VGFSSINHPAIKGYYHEYGNPHITEKNQEETVYCLYSLSGWWYTYPPEKYEFVNGKDDIPYIMENIIHV
jgi:hypothetical protein